MWSYNYPSYYTYPNYICHHGIKGMKWGIRRTPEQLGHKASAKHRNKADRTSYAESRIAYRKKKYDDKLAAKRGKAQSIKNESKRNKQLAKIDKKQEKTASKAVSSAKRREVASLLAHNYARVGLVKAGSAFVGAMALANPATMPAAIGAMALAQWGVIGVNAYKTYQGVRNYMALRKTGKNIRKKN